MRRHARLDALRLLHVLYVSDGRLTPASLFHVIHIHSFMTKYIIWCRRTNVPNPMWADMPFGARYLDDAESLIEYYESEWGNLYEYTAVPVGSYPPGMREPCFVGRM